MLVGAFVLFGQGSLAQLMVGMMICALSIGLYNYVRPYDMWQNNFLQNCCQITIFLTLLGGLIIRAAEAENPGPAGSSGSNAFIGAMLTFATLITTGLLVPVAIMQSVPEPVKDLQIALRTLYRAACGSQLGSIKDLSRDSFALSFGRNSSFSGPPRIGCSWRRM